MALDPPSEYRVCVLGPLAIDGPGGPVDAGGRKPRLLLALLIAGRGSVVTAEALIDGLWGEEPPATARKTLQVHVSNLRRSLGPDFPLETVRAGYRIPAERLEIDVAEFERELDSGRTLLASDPAGAREVLVTALSRWRGPPYADLGDEDALRPEIGRLAELRLTAIEKRVDADLRLGRHDQVLSELESLTTDHPYRERLRWQHMLALYRAGRQTDALRAYERTRLMLAEELGLDPGPDLRVLHQQLLEQAPELDLAVEAQGTSAPDALQEAGGARTDLAVEADTVPAVATVARVAQAPPGDWAVRGYELRECLGLRNGVAVHRAYQPSVGREVALRVIPPALANQPGFVKRFDAECQQLARLEHPHILSIFDYWRDPDGAYVAMPLLAGGTLEHALERGVWHAPAALQLVEQLGAALTHAHRRGVVHGDLRPSNVLLDADGNGYLSDFTVSGEAGLAGADRAESAYLSPEQLAGRPIGPSTDIHGLAVLTCLILTGARPEDAVFTRVDLPPTFGKVIRRATDPDASRRYEKVEHFVRALRQAFGVDVVSGGKEPALARPKNPYKGLAAFGETDAQDFFGREELVEQLVRRLSHHNLVAVVGPSGSGKSSLVKAGLIPAARRGAIAGRDVVVAEMFPGTYPFEELQSALLRVAVVRPADLLAELSADERGLLRVSKQILPDDDTDLLLVIDQFEELFALTADESARQMFLAGLVTAATDERSRVRVVLTMRADFFDKPLNYPAFGALLQEALVAVTLPDESALAEAIAEPARRVGLELEPGLVPTILSDVANEPGALPMMQYALTELAETCVGGTLTLTEYQRIGGVVGALATRAEEIYAGLSPVARVAARELFLRLVTVSDEADDTRRRVRRTELEGLDTDHQSLQTVIDTYGSFRLLSFDSDPITRGPTVEVAHEALIREWPRYRQWIDDRRDDVRTERRLEAAVTEWRQGDRDPSFLITGGRLEQYERWVEAARIGLTADERAFLEESRQETRRHTAVAAKRRRRVLVALSALAAVAVLAALVAIVQRNRADDKAREAAEQSRLAAEEAATSELLRAEAERRAVIDQARALAGRTDRLDDPDLRLLLALEAQRALRGVDSVDPAVSSALYQGTYDHNIVARVPVAGDLAEGARSREPNLTAVGISTATSPDWSMVVATQRNATRARVFDVSTGAVVGDLDVSPSGVVGSAWSESGLVMTGLTNGSIVLWEPTGERVRVVEPGTGRGAVWPLLDTGRSIVYLQFGNVQASFGFSSVVAYDPTSGEVVFRSPQTVFGAEPSRSGDYLLVAQSVDLDTRIYRTDTWADVTPARLSTALGNGVPNHAQWSADGRLWVLSDGVVRQFTFPDGEEVSSFETTEDRSDFMALDREGQRLAVAGLRPKVEVFDTSTAELITTLGTSSGTTGDQTVGPEISSMAWGADGRLVLGEAGAAVVWDLATPNAADAIWTPTGTAPMVAHVLPSGQVLVGSERGGVETFSSQGDVLRLLPERGDPLAPPLVSRDGMTMAVPAGNDVEIVDVASGEVRAVGPTGFGRPLALSADGALAAVGSSRDPDDPVHSVALIDARTGVVLHSLGTLIDGERGAFTTDGTRLVVPISRVAPVTALPSSGLSVFDVSTGDLIGRGPPQNCITAAAVSGAGTTVASVGCDGTVSLFDVETLLGPEPWTARVGVDVQVVTPGVGVTFGPGDETVLVTRDDGLVESFGVEDDFSRRWALDVGDYAGVPSVRGDMVWVGVVRETAIGPPARGVVAMPLDIEEVVELARNTTTRALTDAECQEFVGRTTCSQP